METLANVWAQRNDASHRNDDVGPVLARCWASVADAGPTTRQHWANVPWKFVSSKLGSLRPRARLHGNAPFSWTIPWCHGPWQWYTRGCLASQTARQCHFVSSVILMKCPGIVPFHVLFILGSFYHNGTVCVAHALYGQTSVDLLSDSIMPPRDINIISWLL